MNVGVSTYKRRDSAQHSTPHSNMLVLKAIVFATTLLTSVMAESCPGDRAIALCCRSKGPYSDNTYLFKNICHIEVEDESTIMGAGCGVMSVDDW